MPYSTLDTILKRGINKANVVNVIKICNALDINVDKLANGTIENSTFSDRLANDETLLLKNYNKLNCLGKKEANKRISELTEIER